MSKYFEDDHNYKKLLRVLKSWEGTPYRHLTLVKGRGADCALFVGGVMKDLGILKEVIYDYYPIDWYIHTKEEYVVDGILMHMKDHIIDTVKIKRYRPDEVKLFRGDMLTFSMRDNGISNHAAYYLDDDRITHSINKIGVHCIKMPSFFFKNITNIFRLLEK